MNPLTKKTKDTTVGAFLLGFLALSMCTFLSLESLAASKSSRKSGKTIRLALLIGHNLAGGRAAPLRYAELDAKKIRDILVQLGGYHPRHIWLFAGQPASVIQRGMTSIKQNIQRLKTKHPKARVILFVYYSGHAQKGRLFLGRSSLLFRDLKNFMKRSKASLKLGVFDACESGAMLDTKGLKRRKSQFQFPFVRLAPAMTGEVIISATGAKESAHEDARLRGGIFTHYLLSGLRGAADHNNDGHVTLQEAYIYSYNRSLERTILSKKGPQRARFAKRLSGYGSLVLTTLSKQRAWVRFHKSLRGEFFIWTPKYKLLLAEVVKNKGRTVTMALPPGQYILKWRRRGGVYHQDISLKKGQRFRLGKVGKRLAYWKANTRGSAPLKTKGEEDTGLWQSFHGQLVGPGIGASYRIGYSGFHRGILHQGGGLHFLLPMEGLGAGRMSILMQGGYQFGFDQINDSLKFNLHLVELDVGAVWTLVERPHWWIAAGGLFRTTLIFQSLFPRPGQEEDLLLSVGFGPAGIFSIQYGFSERMFVQFDIIAGLRILDLGGQWAMRWDLHSSMGFGLRF